jgi:hypothetical protein
MSYECPTCKSTQINVTVLAQAMLVQHAGTAALQTDISGEHLWSNISPMACLNCGHEGFADGFHVQPEGSAPTPLYQSSHLRTLSDYGFKSGFYLDDTDNLVPFLRDDNSTSVRLVLRKQGEPPLVRVCRTVGIGSTISWHSPFYRNANEYIEAAKRDDMSGAIKLDPRTVSIPDAIRLAAVMTRGLDYAALPLAAMDLASVLVISKALTYANPGEYDDNNPWVGEPGEVLPLIDPLRSSAKVTVINEVCESQVPCMMFFQDRFWITHWGKHYSVDTPDGVDDLGKLPAFRRGVEDLAVKGISIAVHSSNGLIRFDLL